jgi:hypothetical protein
MRYSSSREQLDNSLDDPRLSGTAFSSDELAKLRSFSLGPLYSIQVAAQQPEGDAPKGQKWPNAARLPCNRSGCQPARTSKYKMVVPSVTPLIFFVEIHAEIAIQTGGRMLSWLSQYLDPRLGQWPDIVKFHLTTTAPPSAPPLQLYD